MNTIRARRNRQSKYSLALKEVRPLKIAPKGTFDVLDAKSVHPPPSLRRRLASIESVPRSASTRKVPKKTTEASSPFAATWEASAPIDAVAGEQPHAGGVPARHQAKSVVIDLVEPARPAGRSFD